MDCLLVKVTRVKTKGKSLKLNIYYPLTILNNLLVEISRGLDKPQEINLTLVDLGNHKEEIEFEKLELNNSFESIIHLLNEDIVKTERDADFDFASRLRAITANLSKQWEEEQIQVSDYQHEADQLNVTLFSKVGQFFNKKLPGKQEKNISEEPVIVEEYIPQYVEETDDTEEEIAVEEIPVIKPINQVNEPQWETEEEEEDNVLQKKEPIFNPKQSYVSPPKQTSNFSFEDYLQTKDETAEVISLLNELEMNHQQPIEAMAKKLGINVVAPSPLEKKQLDYLSKTQDHFLFHVLKSRFVENLNQLDTALLKTLENLYLESGIVEHELNNYVEQLSQSKKNEIINQQRLITEELLQKLVTERETKLAELQTKQALELQNLKAKHTNENQRVITDATIYEENEKERLSKQQKEELEQALEFFRVTSKESKKEEISVKLTSDKAYLQVQRQDAVAKEIQDTVHTLDEVLKGIKFSLIEKQAEFEAVVSKEEENRIQQEIHNLKEMELKIKQEEIQALATQKDNGELQRQQQYDIMMATLQANIMQNQSPNSQGSTAFPEKIDVNLPGDMNQSKKYSPWLKQYLFGAGVVVLLCGSFLGTQLYQASQLNKKHQSEAALMKENNEELMNKLSTLADEKTVLQGELDEKKQSLDYLLSVKDYETAIKLYDTELDKIETAMFEDGDVKSLKAFNDKYSSLFGRLDEAILRGKDKEIFRAYSSLSKNTTLPANRKSLVLSTLYQIGEWTEANQLFND